MRKLENIKFDPKVLPFSQLLFAVTNDETYNADRCVVYENYPEYGEYTVIQGRHCSCYGFDDIEWDAMTYSADELRSLAQTWAEEQWEPSLSKVARMLITHLR